MVSLEYKGLVSKNNLWPIIDQLSQIAQKVLNEKLLQNKIPESVVQLPDQLQLDALSRNWKTKFYFYRLL